MALNDKLRVWQKDLIDISRRNALLYYSDTGRGAGLRLYVEDANDLFARLVGNNRTPISFDQMCTDLDGEELTRKLTRLRANAREDINERGINTLYLAFGVLERYEAPASEECVRSPLVLLPVLLHRQGVAGAFQLGWLGDENIEINPALREVLAQQFDMHLPTFEQAMQVLGPADEEEAHGATATPALSAILEMLEGYVSSEPRWRVVPEIHLCRFSFQKLVMYDDLRRNEAAVLAHPILQVIGGTGERLLEPSGLVGADQLDDRVRPHDMLEILDADSSQQEAIVAAKAGASFVLQGPPGTGKSQTIANIIAECLGQGKRVLFVSEKMAALDVVRQRLSAAGLGEYCLDLHDPRKDKKTFIGELREALHAAESPERSARNDWQHPADMLERQRTELNRFVRELHVPRFALGISAFRALGELVRLDGTPDRDLAIAHIETMTQADLQAIQQVLKELAGSHEVLDDIKGYPWADTKATEYSLELEANIKDHFGRIISALDRYEGAVARLREGVGDGTDALTFEAAEHVRSWIERALAGPRPQRHWLGTGEASRILPVARDLAGRCERYWTHRAQLDPRYDRTVLDLDLASLQRALTDGAQETMSALKMPDPQESVLVRRDEIATHLGAARSILSELMPIASTIAEMLGLPAPTTANAAGEVLRWAEWVLATPNPPREWLDPARFTALRAGVNDADERYGEVARLRARIDSLYDTSYFAIDLPGFAARYRQRYQSLLRYLNLQYHQDARRLRSLLKPGQNRSAAQIETDLHDGVKLVQEDTWLREHRVEHAQLLGHYFDGERTDWIPVRSALVWASELSGLLAGDELSDEVVRLVTGPARGLAALRSRRDQLADCWAHWQDEAPYLDELLRAGALAETDSPLGEIDAQDLDAALQRIEHGLAEFWAAADAIEAHQLLGTHAASEQTLRRWQGLCEDVALAQQIAELEIWFAEHQVLLASDLGPDFSGAYTDWSALIAGLEWAQAFCSAYPAEAVPDALSHTASWECTPAERHELTTMLAGSATSMQVIDTERAFVETVLPIESLLAPEATVASMPISMLRERVEYHLETLPCLANWIVCRNRMERCQAHGLGSLLEVCAGNGPFPRNIYDIFERRFYTLWLDRVRAESSILRHFSGPIHESMIAQFRELDDDHKYLARARLSALLSAWRLQAFDPRQINLGDDFGHATIQLKRELAKKRHRAIRSIVNSVGPALLALKPCWMMSPLSVSQFVATSAQVFDVVIFDEASQVCPEDAICAILRGKQLIVVGDSKQLPPTRFFAKTLADIEDEEDLDADEDLAELNRTESILDECLAAAFPERRLRWHYRSQHESLIAFSNHHFYGDDLITFPASAADHAAGVRWEYVEDGIYQRGGSRTNPREAERVVDLIVDYMRSGRDLALLGVIALSEAQQMAIKNAVERRLKAEPVLRAKEHELDTDDAGKFFIKNLESVQGDERDVIILSIGYGRTADGGRPYINFGPIIRKGGERRLNVAVTRAKSQMIVVASIHASELPAQLANPGAKALRDYLDYAEHDPAVLQHQIAIGDQTSERPPRFDSPFEAAVYRALEAKGLSLATQVGCSSFRIDLAVRVPASRDAYLLGIECDGTMYHSSATARDRDRLRRSHLERMGWKIHRIWSSDWRANPAREVERVLAAVESAQERRLPKSITISSSTGSSVTTAESAAFHEAGPGHSSTTEPTSDGLIALTSATD
jgi:very-short-patch-repair endonuclease